MMSRDNWFELNGYPEFDMYSMNIDSVFEFMAYHAGNKEMVIGDIYHMDHDSGYKPEDIKGIDERMREKGLYSLTNHQLTSFPLHMEQGKIKATINTDKWGFADLSFKETVINKNITSVTEKSGDDETFNPKDICDTDYWKEYLSQESKIHPLLAFFRRPVFRKIWRSLSRVSIIRISVGFIFTAIFPTTPFKTYITIKSKKAKEESK
jgi:hypothetical protein